MVKSSVLLAVMSGLVALPAFAEEAAKIGTSVKEVLKNKKFEENREITNAELRADSGSRSRYSLQSYLSYDGAAVTELDSDKLPNPDNQPDRYTKVGGSLSLKYRVNSKSALNFGTGISAETPFHGVEKVYLQDPTVGWATFYRVGLVEMKTGFSTAMTTNENYADKGQVWSFKYSQSFSRRLSTSPIQIGLSTSLQFFVFDREFREEDGNVSNWFIGLYPDMSYDLSDKVAIRTSLGQGYSNPREKSEYLYSTTRELNQRLGLGVSVSKDIYFHPYLSFAPNENFTWDSTSVSFSTTVSVF